MRAEFAPADASKYNNLLFGPLQGTGGSTSIANSFLQYRKAGAIARVMLMQAAAAAWGVPVAEIVVTRGALTHSSGRSGTFGEFAEKAATLDVPKDALLKDAEDFAYIGKGFKRLDTEAKITGQPIFSQDTCARHTPRAADETASPRTARLCYGHARPALDEVEPPARQETDAAGETEGHVSAPSSASRPAPHRS